MKNELTERQEEVLNFIKEHLNEKGYPPTLREIGKRFNIVSTFGVKRHLDALGKKGKINVDSNISRSITIVNLNQLKAKEEKELQRSPNEIPIVGRVAAGLPILAVENIDGYLTIDQRIVKNSKNCFALKVKGDSMINAGLFEDDIVVVSPQKYASNGEIIIALLGDDATVKRFEVRGYETFLVPENVKYTAIQVNDREDFSIIGKVVGVIRWYN
ncbi:MAG: transcriptional repressor LexA [Ignavibacteriales bacterium]|nr:transcriptional repressor LexA [Ignavibacteriales bacterium]